MKNLLFAILLALLAFGCSETKEVVEEVAPEPEPPKYETGRVALQRLYVTARGWAPDAQPFRVESEYTPEAPAREGALGIWRAGFVSSSRGAVKSFMWSGVDGEGMPGRGVTPSVEDRWNPNNQEQQPFDMAFLKIDTPQAFEVAQEKGGKQLLEKNPDLPVFYRLHWNPRANQLSWRVLYGASRTAPELQIAVDASTGKFIRRVK